MSDTSEPRLYTDVAPEEIEQDKRKILKQLATTGRRSLKDIEAADIDADKRLYDLYDEDLAQGTPAMVAAELDRQRSSILAGHDTARGMLGAAHNEELDRIAAATGAYKDKMAAAVPALDTYLQAQIAAIKQAAEDRRRGSGGGARPLTALEQLEMEMMQWQFDRMREAEDAGEDAEAADIRNAKDELFRIGASVQEVDRVRSVLEQYEPYVDNALNLYVTTMISGGTSNDADIAVTSDLMGKGLSMREASNFLQYIRAQLGYATQDDADWRDVALRYMDNTMSARQMRPFYSERQDVQDNIAPVVATTPNILSRNIPGALHPVISLIASSGENKPKRFQDVKSHVPTYSENVPKRFRK